MRADSAVEPTKSENITVTWRRSARSSGRVLGVFDVVAGSTDACVSLNRPDAFSLGRANEAVITRVAIQAGENP
jgi:hypothetical protein